MASDHPQLDSLVLADVTKAKRFQRDCFPGAGHGASYCAFWEQVTERLSLAWCMRDVTCAAESQRRKPSARRVPLLFALVGLHAAKVV
eukprot:365466-Chlamydomonas_euryale.AAC.6